MYDQEKIKPYDNSGDKAAQVEKMFDSIAPTYDKLNHQLSWNIDKGWRRKAINALSPYNPRKILDVASGTRHSCRQDVAPRQPCGLRHL